MGNQELKEIQYSIPVAEKKQGETEIRRHKAFLKELCKDININGKILDNQQSIFLEIAKTYPTKPFIGTITKGGVQYKTYDQILQLAKQLGSGIINMKLAPEINEFENFKLRLIGMFAKNREEWMVLDLSNALYKGVLVPIYETLGPETITYVIKHSGITSCFCNDAGFKSLMKTEDLGNLQTLITFDPVDPADQEKAKAKKLNIIKYEDVLESGKKQEHPFVEIKGDDVFTFSYTSGTTDIPKGAMISHRNLVCIQQGAVFTSAKVMHDDVYYSYLPLPHIFERFVVYTIISVGATVVFSTGDIRKIKEELAIVKPTFFCGVPRVFNRFYQAIRDQIEDLTGYKKYMVQKAIDAKLENLRNNCQYTHSLWDNLVFNKMKNVMGGRCRFMLTGSAPTSPVVLDFLKIAICCPILNGYGQTESIGGSIITVAEDSLSGHVGGVMPGLEVKLVDVPEMDYLTTEKNSQGQLTPKGEICLRGPQLFLGYYKDPKNTKETIDTDGWVHTGDIGELLHNGGIKVIDRKKNIFKLAQGEYVAPDKIENIYVRVKGVAEVFVYGDSLESYLVAIIVPNSEVFLEIAKSNNIAGTFEELCKSKEMNKIILKSLQDKGKAEGLFGFEQVQKIYLEPKSFTIHNCMTNTFKIQRFLAKKIFKSIIADLYAPY